MSSTAEGECVFSYLIRAWKRTLEKSSTNSVADPLTSLMTVREGIPSGVRVKVTSVRKDGTRRELGSDKAMQAARVSGARNSLIT
jgi:hypothetical protein